MSSEALKTIVTLWAKKRNLPEEEVKTIMDSLNNENSPALKMLQDYVDIMQKASSILGSAPDGLKQALATALLSYMQPATSGEDDTKKFIERLTTTLAAMKMALGDESSKYVEQLQQKIEALEKILQEKEKEEMRKELNEQLASVLAEMQKNVEERIQKIEETLQKITQAFQQNQQQAQQKTEEGGVKTVLSTLKSVQQELDNLKQLLEMLGYRIEKPKSVLDQLDEISKELSKYGYKLVKDSEQKMTVDEMIKYLQSLGYRVEQGTVPVDKLKEVEENAYRRGLENGKKIGREEAEIEKKRMELVTDIIKTVAENIFGMLSSSVKEKYEMRKAQIAQKLSQQQSAQQQSQAAVSQ